LSQPEPPVMNKDRILAAIPHRPPMLLVDEVVEREDRRIVCRKTYHEDEFFFQGHYPDFPLVPGVILCESAMQAGAILLSGRFPADARGAPVATRMNNVKFKRMIRPGDVTVIEVFLDEQLSNAFYLRAKVKCEDRLAVGFDFACALAETTGGDR
jgi:3-hydroxyacyl-[acyl-carrier-protein] dehydratase